MSDRVNQAKEVLLRALDMLDYAERSIEGEADRVDLIVVFATGRADEQGIWHEYRGWVNTPGPKWAHEKLLEDAALSQASYDIKVDRPDDDER